MDSVKLKAILITIVFAVCFIADAPTLGLAWMFPFFSSGYQDLKINLGLDLQGGMDLIYEVVSETGGPVSPEIVTRTVEVLQNRLDEFGVANLMISRQGDAGIRIQIPGLTDKMQKRVKELIATTDLLTFNYVLGASSNVMEIEKNAGEIILPHVEPPQAAQSTDTDRAEWFRLKEKPELTGESLSFARIGYDTFGAPKILLEFNSEGRRVFGDVTSKMVGQRLAIVLAGKVYTAPVIKEPIRDGSAEITGKFDLEETKRIVNILKAGALPAKMRKLGENVVGPTLGAESIRAGVIACAVGVGLVLLYMCFWYKTCGFFADLGLIFCALIVLTLMLFFRATLTMPGIAGLILTLGMAVDANVLIFERTKEELRLGKTVRASIDAGFDKAWIAIFDSNVTMLISTLVLYWFGTGAIKGFAVTLGIGVLAQVFTCVIFVRAIMEAFYSGKTVGTISI